MSGFQSWFSVAIFFILLRETLEAAVIVSVLLSLVAKLDLGDQPQEGQDDITITKNKNRATRIRHHMQFQIWLGAATGLLIALMIGAVFITVWYTVASNWWSKAEDLWEGCFSIVACLLITVMSLAMLRVGRLQEKWRVKLTKAFPADEIDDFEQESRTSALKRFFRTQFRSNRGSGKGRWALFLLPMVTVLREGLESVVFMGGVSLAEPPTSIPLAALAGIFCGLVVGYILWRGGMSMKIHLLMVTSTCFLLLIAAGLASKAVWFFEMYVFNSKVGLAVDDNLGDGPGSFRTSTMVWHIPGTNPEQANPGGWGVFNAILGWQGTATYGSVITYCVYWIGLMVWLVVLRLKERRKERKERKNVINSGYDEREHLLKADQVA
ncbi:high-affinity iron permease CaFTR1 [Planoprotostelium fungivorum]|uniref:High-affinity iron permease CaFTR1 n=1 Tax=Planoprotostelium fungivorum TaxID=1890364 RepID=A0A2P6MUY5_9EUKA|nr:high-affinity iron permease CaFTR1 [Planoprotostelium fungivorum]